MHCPAGNATDPIWISSWTPLTLSNPNPNPLANQLLCIGFLTPPTPLIIPHRLRAFLESLMPLKNWCSIYARCSKSSLKHSIHFCGIFSKNRILLHIVLPHVQIVFLKFTSCGQSGFSRVYSKCCCSCSFEPEIIKIDQSSYKMYSNNILTFQESMTILNTCTKKSGNLLKVPCMYWLYLSLNNLKWLICHKTNPNQAIFSILFVYLFCMCKWAYVVFPSIYSVLVYHRYTNTNIGC